MPPRGGLHSTSGAAALLVACSAACVTACGSEHAAAQAPTDGCAASPCMSRSAGTDGGAGANDESGTGDESASGDESATSSEDMAWPDCNATLGNVCAPGGFPFVLLAEARNDQLCPGPDCRAPVVSLSQPEPGTLCTSGTGSATGSAWLLLGLAATNQSRTNPLGTRIEPFDAEARGITRVTFSIDSPPPSGVFLALGVVVRSVCLDNGLPDCIEFAFRLPSLSAGTTSVALADFSLDDRRPDTSALAQIGFLIVVGAYEFCVRDFKFLNDAGDEVTASTPG